MSHIPPFPHRAHRALPHWPPLQDSRGRTITVRAVNDNAPERITFAQVLMGSLGFAAATLLLIWLFALAQAVTL